MNSHTLLRLNLIASRDRTLARITDMREHALVFPTPRGGCHTLWVLGHLAYIEQQIVHEFMLGDANPIEHWKPVFDGYEVSGDAATFPPFDQVLATCLGVRASTLALLDTLTEPDLDRTSARIPAGYDDTFGTYRSCLQFTSDHWNMHRGNLADARRAAGLERMWV